MVRFDLVAGLRVRAVLVPEALAYATIAGVSCRAATSSNSMLRVEPAVTQPDLGMADGSLLRHDGVIAVRADRRILEVDPTGLPERFAKLKFTRSAVAQTVANVVLRCWKG
jgi:hypothetical protein